MSKTPAKKPRRRRKSVSVALPAPGARVHLVGVCGMGMAPLALALLGAGYRVTGEDKHWPEEVGVWMADAGVERVPTGELPDKTALLIRSAAVHGRHPTRAAATRSGVPTILRGEALALLVGDRPLIAVVGSHGKTTTTAMLITALRAMGTPFDYVLGGLFANGETPPASWSGKGWVVAEIDESDGTIAGFSPEISLIVNVDWDHCDRYRESSELEAEFSALVGRTKRAVIVPAGCETSARVASGVGEDASVFTFGSRGDFRLAGSIDHPDGSQQLSLGGMFGDSETMLAAAGGFNAMNAVGALAVASLVVPGNFRPGQCGLGSFSGVRRRQSVLLSQPGLTVIEDYAHHPAEVEALLGVLRARASKRLVVVFQPHRYSRTAQFKEGFARVLSTADRLMLLEVYAAGEERIPGGNSADIIKAQKSLLGTPPTELISDLPNAPGYIADQLEDGDLLAFIGAGDIDLVARRTVALLAREKVATGDWRDGILRAVDGMLEPQTTIVRDEPLGPKTTIRVGGRAALYAEPANTADLQTLLVAAHAANVRVNLLGRGSNLIVPDEGVDGMVIRLNHPHWQRFTCLGPGRYWAGAGLRLKELCGHACRMGEGGFEFLEGIPGTVGGALRMNAGAMGGWMFDRVEEVHLISVDGTFHILKRNDLHVEYRKCAELEHAIAIGAVLIAAGNASTDEIRKRISAHQSERATSQPREPSAGCIFKNPEGESAGRIIDELGLKGLRVGDAEVSLTHGNFIINRGHASGSDVIALVRRLREEVRDRRSIELEPEALLYGHEWKEVLG